MNLLSSRLIQYIICGFAANIYLQMPISSDILSYCDHSEAVVFGCENCTESGLHIKK